MAPARSQLTLLQLPPTLCSMCFLLLMLLLLLLLLPLLLMPCTICSPTVVDLCQASAGCCLIQTATTNGIRIHSGCACRACLLQILELPNAAKEQLQEAWKQWMQEAGEPEGCFLC